MNASHSIAASLCFLFAFSSPAAEPSESEQAEENPKWFLIEGTASPNGRYALAWKLRNEPKVWEEVCESYRNKDQRDYGDDSKLEVPSGNVENLIVDTKAGRVVQKLPSDYWELPHSRPNRHFLEAVWSPKCDLLVVNHTFRWDCFSLTAVQMTGAKPKVAKIAGPLTIAAQKFAQASPGASDHLPADLNVSFSEVKHFKANTFVGNIHTVAGKMWAANPAQAKFAIVTGKGAPTVKLLSIEKH